MNSKNKSLVFLTLLLIISIAFPVSSKLGNIVIDLNKVNADLMIVSNNQEDGLGYSGASGDINGDGIDDLIIGAETADPSGRFNAGEVYVVYGRTNFEANKVINSNDVDITILGNKNGDHLGFSVASGDINGDGIDDLIIGAYNADPSGRFNAGEVYVVYGRTNFEANKVINFNLVTADILIKGDDILDQLGWSVASGDINGDGIDDLVMGAINANLASTAVTGSGEVYVIYGRTDFEANKVIDFNLVTADILIKGNDIDGSLGSSVASGDINGDGIDDLVMGAYLADITSSQYLVNPSENKWSGQVYVIYGDSQIENNKVIDLKVQNADITVIGNQAYGYLGSSVASGDINGDGTDDLVMGAWGASSSEGINAGKVYVIYGMSTNIEADKIIDFNSMLADITIIGGDVGDALGGSIYSDDINDDGKDDIIAGASFADSTKGINAGEVYVIYGSSDFEANKVIDFNSESADITVIGNEVDNGIRSGLGRSVFSGDINSDGRSDFMMGSNGEIIVVYGGLYNPAGVALPPQAQKPAPFRSLLSGLFFLIFRR